ncbi:methyltransferase-like protein 9 isoform X2 [Eurytemora carolleeae]|uniref:methyltransferase-like protein 9 isoform X2 n=1 Tax=Eurytemora carolleeae TaxID=1294199 RepID=UPI000C7881EF|nr:methyltransferase-like protein 9 isoform X2 [Eurytemora carolleeae]|eukprot:XP_023329764.1 methyltransferase-like protein 9 isoform X2 [Eurytemora affinis]
MRVYVANFLQIFLPLVLVLVFPRILDYCGISRMNYRPRSSLTQVLINKMNAETENGELVKPGWYQVNLQDISDEKMREKFVQLSADTATQEFARQSSEKSDWIFTQLYQNFAKIFMSIFYTQTDINGILGRGSMFVLSREQYLTLTDGLEGEKMIDLGAGDGAPTMSMFHSFTSVYATEASAPMRKILKSNGIQVLEVEHWAEQGPFDLISCLNLLDRADNPETILQAIKASLKPQGLLLIALVLPFRPYVELNVKEKNKPSQLLDIHGDTTEQQIVSAVEVLRRAGFDLVRWSRVPYLCEGDLNQPIYHLTDFILVLKHQDQ